MSKNNKTIGVTVRFFTNGLPERVREKNDRIPCWATGSVHVESNSVKGLTSTNTVKIFRGMENLPKAIKQSMEAAKIVVVNG